MRTALYVKWMTFTLCSALLMTSCLEAILLPSQADCDVSTPCPAPLVCADGVCATAFLGGEESYLPSGPNAGAPSSNGGVSLGGQAPSPAGELEGGSMMNLPGGGATTMPPSGGQPNTGGASIGGEMIGGEVIGGSVNGGETIGGQRPGGATVGGIQTGGESAGGESLGGEVPGGESLAGVGMGGIEVGGVEMGGAEMGGTEPPRIEVCNGIDDDGDGYIDNRDAEGHPLITTDSLFTSVKWVCLRENMMGNSIVIEVMRHEVSFSLFQRFIIAEKDRLMINPDDDYEGDDPNGELIHSLLQSDSEYSERYDSWGRNDVSTPAVGISPEDVEAFSDWMNMMYSRANGVRTNALRLSNRAQWRRIARSSAFGVMNTHTAMNQNDYPWGERDPECRDGGDHDAIFDDNNDGCGEERPAGACPDAQNLRERRAGICDLSGNVREIVRHEDGYKAVGGSWKNDANHIKIDESPGFSEDQRDDQTGARLIRIISNEQ